MDTLSTFGDKLDSKILEIDEYLNSDYLYRGIQIILMIYVFLLRYVIYLGHNYSTKDGLKYVNAAINISNLNFTPLPIAHAWGWPILLSPFVVIFGENADLMLIARIVQCIIIALTVLPLMGIISAYTRRIYAILLTIIFGRLPVAITAMVQDGGGYPGPLYNFLFLAALYYVYKLYKLHNQENMILNDNDNDDDENEDNHSLFFYILVGLLLGFATWVRPNGLIVLVDIFIIIILDKREYWKQWITYGLSTLIITSLPLLVLRAILFGSPLEYGPNSRYFLDRYDSHIIWHTDYHNRIGPIEYLQTHTIFDILARITIGFIESINYIFFSSGFILITMLYLLGFLFGQKDKFSNAVRFIYFPHILAFSFLYVVFSTVRMHSLYAIGLCLVFASIGIKYLDERGHSKIIIILLILFNFIMFYLEILLRNLSSVY